MMQGLVYGFKRGKQIKKVIYILYFVTFGFSTMGTGALDSYARSKSHMTRAYFSNTKRLGIGHFFESALLQKTNIFNFKGNV